MIPLQFLNDSNALFDTIFKDKKTSKENFMLGIATAREKFHDKVIFDIGFVRRNHHLAGG